MSEEITRHFADDITELNKWLWKNFRLVWKFEKAIYLEISGEVFAVLFYNSDGSMGYVTHGVNFKTIFVDKYDLQIQITEALFGGMFDPLGFKEISSTVLKGNYIGKSITERAIGKELTPLTKDGVDNGWEWSMTKDEWDHLCKYHRDRFRT